MTSTQVATITAQRQASLTTTSLPNPQHNWALVKIQAAPMCTEYKAWLRGEQTLMGHEAAGEVVAVGDGCQRQVGERVVVMPQLACGQCHLCLSGDYIHCEHGLSYSACTGHEGQNATMAQYILKPDWLLPVIPEGLSYEHASLACCTLGPSYGALERLAVKASDTVLITGLGPVGLGAVVNASFRRARLVAVEFSAWRREQATALGADLVLDAADPDNARLIEEFSGGRGVAAAIDCSGSPHAQRLAIDSLRRRGQMAFIGESQQALQLLPSPDLLRKGISLTGIWHYNLRHFPGVMDVIQRSPVVAQLISHDFPLSDIQQAFETLARQETAKVLLLPWA